MDALLAMLDNLSTEDVQELLLHLRDKLSYDIAWNLPKPLAPETPKPLTPEAQEDLYTRWEEYEQANWNW